MPKMFGKRVAIKASKEIRTEHTEAQSFFEGKVARGFATRDAKHDVSTAI